MGVKVLSYTVVVVDSHIQRIVLATEETTVTQQVSHRPIKCQSRLWSQRCTKVNGSHHGDNPLLRPTGIQIATKNDATLQAMAPTNVKTVHQTSVLHIIESNLDRLGLLSPTHHQRSQQQTGQIMLQPVLISRSKFLKATQCTKIRKIEKPRSLVVEALSWEACARASIQPSKALCILEKPHESCPFAAPCGPRRKKNDCGQISAFPSKISRFKPVILAHRGSALPWLVDDRAAPCLGRNQINAG